MAMAPESGYTTPSQRKLESHTSTFNTTSYSGVGAASPPVYAPTVSPTVPSAGDELKYLDNELGSLFQFLDALEKRLEPVLTPPGPDSDGSGQKADYASPLVVKLKDETSLLASANRRLSLLLCRVEL